MEGPTLKSGSPQIANLEVALDVTAWRGEVSLLKVEFPKRAKADPDSEIQGLRRQHT